MNGGVYVNSLEGNSDNVPFLAMFFGQYVTTVHVDDVDVYEEMAMGSKLAAFGFAPKGKFEQKGPGKGKWLRSHLTIEQRRAKLADYRPLGWRSWGPSFQDPKVQMLRHEQLR